MIASILPANILAIAVPNSPRLRQISFLLFAATAAGQPEGPCGKRSHIYHHALKQPHRLADTAV